MVCAFGEGSTTRTVYLECGTSIQIRGPLVVSSSLFQSSYYSATSMPFFKVVDLVNGDTVQWKNEEVEQLCNMVDAKLIFSLLVGSKHFFSNGQFTIKTNYSTAKAIHMKRVRKGRLGGR